MKKLFWIISFPIILIFVLQPFHVNAEMMDKYAEPAPVVSSGSFEASLGTRMDFKLSGGNLTGAKWSLAYLSAGYLPTGTIREGENVSLSVTGTQPSGVGDTLVFNSLNMTLIFRDVDNKDIGEVSKFSSGNIKESPLSFELSGVVPEGTRRVILTGAFNSRWTTSVVVAEVASISVELTVEPEPTASPAIVTGTQSETGSSESENSSEPTSILPSGTESTGDTENSEENTKSSGFSPFNGPFRNPWEHAGVIPAVFISLISVVMAILGGAGGGSINGSKTVREPQAFAAGEPGFEDPDQTAYEVTHYGKDGTITKEFPDGHKEIKHPDGTITREEPDAFRA